MVTAFTGKVDVGQDNRTALRLLVAEELGVPLASVRLAMGDTDLCPFDMGTFGSRSMPDAGGVLRRTAAYTKTVLPVRPGERRVERVAGEPARPAESPFPQASYRALAATANNFARESMIDELAHEIGVDPVEFRLSNLADDRLAAVLRAVAEHIGWETGRDPVPGMGVGIACGLEKDGRVVTAAQVVIGRGRQVRVTGLVTGYECGTIVNPHAVRSQIEGATVMAFGGAMFEAIRFSGGAITNAAFSGYRMPRMADIPPIKSS
jgi:CO/xanthine dehydrogenase Mo-binding subunit